MALNPRTDATITLIDHGRCFAKAHDDAGQDIFIYHTAIQTTGRYTFADLVVGAHVRCLVIDHPQGARGIEVEIVTLGHRRAGLDGS